MQQSITLCILLISGLIFEAAAYCSSFQTDLIDWMVVEDYGPNGKRGPITIPLEKGVRPGTVISVVAKTFAEDGRINIHNDKNLMTFYVKMENKIGKNILQVDSSGDNEPSTKLPNPVVRGSLFTTTLVFEEEGYRVFINGKQITFYKHRIPKQWHLAADKLEIMHDEVFKFVYLTNAEETEDGRRNAQDFENGRRNAQDAELDVWNAPKFITHGWTETDAEEDDQNVVEAENGRLTFRRESDEQELAEDSLVNI